MLTEQQQDELYRMTRAIYYHLGLDVDQSTPVSISQQKKQMELEVLKWKEKRAKKVHERETRKG